METINTIEFVLDSIIESVTTYLGGRFEPKEVQADAAKKEMKEQYKGMFTAHLTFDFSGVTGAELVRMGASQTSYQKMWYNNAIFNESDSGVKNWDKDTVEEFCSEARTISIRTLLDTRTRKVGGKKKSIKDTLTEMKAKGMTAEEIMAEFGL